MFRVPRTGLLARRGFADTIVDGDLPRRFFHRLRCGALDVVSQSDVDDMRAFSELAQVPVPVGYVKFEELIHTLTCVGDVGEFREILTPAMEVRVLDSRRAGDDSRSCVFTSCVLFRRMSSPLLCGT